VTLADEQEQSNYVIGRCLEHLEAGIPLRRQAVLFRAAHHSDALEVELGRRNIPYVKYGGLKFLEAAHVKDVLSILRVAENPKDSSSAFRALQLIDGIGPAIAKRAIQHLASGRYDLRAWQSFEAPPAAAGQWESMASLLVKLAGDLPLPDQLAEIRRFYAPVLEKRYDQAHVRARDVEQLEQIAGGFRSRSHMLADLALDPPSGTQDLAGPPLREEDCLILSTIHSAKGCEWDAVYVIHAADGNIPSDMSTGSEEQIEEERRLFYVALTRARDFLEVCFPLRYYQKKWATGDRHTYAQLTRFVPEMITGRFERVSLGPSPKIEADVGSAVVAAQIRGKIAAMWE
jgi:DNA helicase-2/ATP-dependent DNA helicase PcrA